jgi:hypothetical protein
VWLAPLSCNNGCESSTASGAMQAFDTRDWWQDTQEDAAVDSEQVADAPVSMSGRSNTAAMKLREEYASQFMQPEWLVEIPESLGQDWYGALVVIGHVGGVLMATCKAQVCAAKTRRRSLLGDLPKASALPTSQASVHGRTHAPLTPHTHAAATATLRTHLLSTP